MWDCIKCEAKSILESIQFCPQCFAPRVEAQPTPAPEPEPENPVLPEDSADSKAPATTGKANRKNA